jgi:hypothetical protein
MKSKRNPKKPKPYDYYMSKESQEWMNAPMGAPEKQSRRVVLGEGFPMIIPSRIFTFIGLARSRRRNAKIIDLKIKPLGKKKIRLIAEVLDEKES